MSRPVPYSVRDVPTAFLDPRTAAGVVTDGRAVPPLVKSGAGVEHYLRAALAAGVERVFLVGKRPPAGWLFHDVAGWRTAPAGHYIDPHGLDVARFEHATSHRVELLRAAAWFGWGDYTPRQAADAWRGLGVAHARAFGGAKLLASPSGTGADAWARSLSDKVEVPLLDDETQELIRATAVQHHVDLMPREGKLPGFVYMDGRFMFAALTKELGVGPVVRDAVDSVGCGELHCPHKPRCGYDRARYRVTATVPADWPWFGILPHKLGDEDWEWPREPGRTFDTWCDGVEAQLARRWGWNVKVHERILFRRGRPLDTWTERLVKARAHVDTWDDPVTRGMVKGALRALLIQTIGAFHSTGRDATRYTFTPLVDGPPAGVPFTRHGEAIVWREPRPLVGRSAAFRHPEWSAAVWSRSHVRILDHRATGVLNLPPEWVIGVRGDAVYLTDDPEWEDDGAVGRLRVKGRISEPVKAPADLTALNALREKAEKNESA